MKSWVWFFCYCSFETNSNFTKQSKLGLLCLVYSLYHPSQITPITSLNWNLQLGWHYITLLLFSWEYFCRHYYHLEINYQMKQIDHYFCCWLDCSDSFLSTQMDLNYYYSLNLKYLLAVQFELEKSICCSISHFNLWYLLNFKFYLISLKAAFYKLDLTLIYTSVILHIVKILLCLRLIIIEEL